MEKQCPFCHKNIPVVLFPAHVAEHTKLRADGQMTDHVTLAPEQRFAGELESVPQWYRHDKCGEVTGMPEEIVRSYLSDPFLYNEYTFCTGCQKYPHLSEFHWTETGENLLAYNRRLKLEYVQRNKLGAQDFVWEGGFPVKRKRKLSGLILAAGCLVAAVVLVGVIAAAGAGMLALLRPAPSTSAPAYGPQSIPSFSTEPAFPSGPSYDVQQQLEDMQRQMREQHESMLRRQDEIQREHERMLNQLRGQ